jgi:2-polyprenyl-3-methyl-5-hydroxy-6-metoxy-1,4-benzoquinol methylase
VVEHSAVVAEGAAAAVDQSVRRCVLCGGTEWCFVLRGRDEYFGVPGEFRLVRCARCELVCVDPPLAEERLRAHYPNGYYAFHPAEGLPSVVEGRTWWQRAALGARGYGGRRPGPLARAALAGYAAVRSERVRIGWRPVPRCREGGRLLDVGCGAGFFAAEMRRLGWAVSCLDASERACRVARERYGLEVHCGTIEDAPFPDASFDVVTIWETLEHLPDPVAALRRISRWLVPGGIVMGSVPNFGCPYRWWYGEAYYPLELPRHLYHFARPTLRRLLAHTGFSGIAIRSYTAGASVLLLSRQIRRNRRAGTIGIPPEFWQGKSARLRAATWSLKPVHAVLDALGLGVGLEFEAVRA